MGTIRALPIKGFNPRPRAGGDPPPVTAAPTCLQFQSTPPRGGRHPPSVDSEATCRVSIHAPAWGATDRCRRSEVSVSGFQSTPPRGGRHATSLARSAARRVSIHAPARGATRPSSRSRAAPPSFNPRPRAGGDWRTGVDCSAADEFQSTPPRGGRPDRGACPSRIVDVSIHAPARGATPAVELAIGRIQCFNPRPRAGGDARRSLSVIESTSFNPRPRAGGDSTPRDDACLAHGFQSTPPRGGRRPARRVHVRLERVSIHAPARGATSAAMPSSISADVSIHAPARGATSARMAVHVAAAEFQSTPPRGGRPLPHVVDAASYARFNPRPRAGGDERPRQRMRQRSRCFNPRPRAGGDSYRCASTRRRDRVSIHAPARGATSSARCDATSQIAFQSTPPRGGRRPLRRYARQALSVSIHAPARGATTPHDQRVELRAGFNPRPRAGGDASTSAEIAGRVEFQSTPPRGGRPRRALTTRRQSAVSIHAPARGATSACDAHACGRAFQSTPPRGGRPAMRAAIGATASRFNPRPRAGGDRVHGSTLRRLRLVSIHAPARGATSHAAMRIVGRIGFNPRPRAGGDVVTSARRHADVRVSIHAPARGATIARRLQPTMLEFQSTPPRGGRPAQPLIVGESAVVSIHAPARGATAAYRGRRRDHLFQSTPPRGGRPAAISRLIGCQSSFNPRPRAGGDAVICVIDADGLDVSIHAPARGATDVALDMQSRSTAFQSTPPRGGRPADPRRRSQRSTSFNPRPRAGGDAAAGSASSELLTVSIHAPARGATRWRWTSRQRRRCFNPRPRAGGDGIGSAHRSATTRFQSTPPRGGRPATAVVHRDAVSIHAPARGATAMHGLVPHRDCFNPRPRAGGDRTVRRRLPHVLVSIHAPARGATCDRSIRDAGKFQSTPPRGGRRVGRLQDACCCSFNPRPRAGGDRRIEARHALIGFNPRPRAGGDNWDPAGPVRTRRFNPRPPRGATWLRLRT